MLQESGRTIALIEADTSLRRLMVLGLAQHGIQVIEGASLADLTPGQLARVELLVLDIDGRAGSDWSLVAEARKRASLTPLVVLAWEEMLGREDEVAYSSQAYLAKPFDARVLYTTVESLLESLSEPALAFSPAAAPAPSLWPLLTAAGLLLTIIGLMVSMLLTGLGLLVILAALLSWTLTPGATRNERPALYGVG